MQIKKFKIRASAASNIKPLVQITEKQLQIIAEYTARKNGTGNPLTAKMESELADLIAKRDAPPQLSQTAKTYCEKWLKQQIYGIYEEFSSKFTEKGILCEPAALALTCKMKGYDPDFTFQNTKQYENEYFTGMPDLVLPDKVDDTKCSYSIFTFPLFADKLPDEGYYDQLQVYADLTGANNLAVNYCLIDMPAELIEREAVKQSFKAGYTELDSSLYDECYLKMTYGATNSENTVVRDAVDDKLRFKSFQFQRNQDYINSLKKQVIACREYIAGLVDKLNAQGLTITIEP